jgi:phage terminase large subunit
MTAHVIGPATAGLFRHLPPIFQRIMRPSRYKIMYGGRGAGKTVNVASIIIALSYTIDPALRKGFPFRVLCGREFQSSIADSVHYELVDAINQMGLSHWFKVSHNAIRCWVTGAVILFRGFHHNIDQIKSLGGIDLLWGEEAHSLSEDSLVYLDPTIRRDAPLGPFGQGSELWFTLNQHDETDPMWKRIERGYFLEPGDTIIVPITHRDNPYFPTVLERQRAAMERDDDAGIYEWVWGTSCRRMGSSIILNGKFVVEDFETPTGVEQPRFFHGVDWGFSADPTAMIRAYEIDNHFYIDQEAYGNGIELEELPALFAGTDTHTPPRWKNPVPESEGGTGARWPGIPTSPYWPVKADSARPELISYVRRRGFTIDAAEKWSGSVEDGIAHIKGFSKIHIHQRCKHTAREARLYSYKVDPKNGDVLPLVLDKHNHTWDAARYSLDGYIQRRGGLAVWERLADQ